MLEIPIKFIPLILLCIFVVLTWLFEDEDGGVLSAITVALIVICGLIYGLVGLIWILEHIKFV